MKHIIGTCSLCCGPVGYREHWMSTLPQTPRCLNCGAEPINPFGPIIGMRRPRWELTFTPAAGDVTCTPVGTLILGEVIFPDAKVQ